MTWLADDPAAAERHTTQYFEMYGNRGIYHDGWIASTLHLRAPLLLSGCIRGLRTRTVESSFCWEPALRIQPVYRFPRGSRRL